MNPSNPNPQVPVKTITVKELYERSLERTIEIVDVRTPQEFFEIRAATARNAPLDTLEPNAVLASRKQDADEPLYLICKMGGRSAHACMMFMAAGYSNVVNVEGGTDAWAEAGLPVEQGD